MTYLTSEEEYTFKVTFVFWKFYELGKYFELKPSDYYLTHFFGAYKALKFIKEKVKWSQGLWSEWNERT